MSGRRIFVRPLGGRERDAARAVVELTLELGRRPTYREIGWRLGVGSSRAYTLITQGVARRGAGR